MIPTCYSPAGCALLSSWDQSDIGVVRRQGGGTEMTQSDELDAPEALLTPSEVAALFRVNPKTVTRWARAGKLTAIRTLGGHRRFRVSEIRRCLEEMSQEEA